MEISKLKKMVQLELSSSENGIISIENWDYSPQFFVALFEDSDVQQALKFHLLIWNSKVLLDFLEKQIWAGDIPLFDSISVNSSSFSAFIAPYFTFSFAKILGKCLYEKDFDQATVLLKYQDHISDMEFDNAYQSVRMFFLKSMQLFKNISKDNYKKHISDITVWANTNWPQFFNTLPNYFSVEIDELSRKIINLTVEIQKANRVLTARISIKLTQLNLEEGLKKLVLKNHKIYLSKTRFVEIKFRGKKRIVNKYTAFFIFLLCLILSIFIAITINVWYHQYKKEQAGKITNASFEKFREKNSLFSQSFSPQKTVYYYQKDSILFDSFDPAYYNFSGIKNQKTVVNIHNKTSFNFYIYKGNSDNIIPLPANKSQTFTLDNRIYDIFIVVKNYKELTHKYGNNQSDSYPKIYGLHPFYTFKTKDNSLQSKADTISLDLRYQTGMISTAISKPKSIDLFAIY
ncbi:hypothetical protein [Rhizosphaericola mali]|uniref:Uncharacterized protein n=1 Tax=Rhizosphaericola mali TaxID=2545455 RepID=A0A5P2FV73_9BACT|nr:hypothetical protein [Rhizosphaericola mali]QES87386.1 hypothetical protein E0W69_001490 [Rhizosphaericola mali]